ncbi:hypothetical protein [Spirosoma oryzicola]|uniref:hypothetical protein n=1 Tax=Spirosoma oryzicola TaxID=2898794 RepID=UPI001E603222|nr:hypothetical protein [Spirosoma oryzicola]UHG90823.1 hypothetical protein LQ777_21585 [Spirosoma oryzicola]
MTDHERIDELERQVAFLQAQQETHITRLNQVLSRLTFLEARQYRLMRELGITPTMLDNTSTAQMDAQEILRTLPTNRLN